jgi:hypothetical protein
VVSATARRSTLSLADMTTPFSELLSTALSAHTIDHTSSGPSIELPLSGVTFDGEFVDGPIHVDTVLLQLNVATAAPLLDGRVVRQSFAGIGASRQMAERDAFGKFLLGSLHVLLCTLAAHECDSDGTAWSIWGNGAAQWRVCDSALLVQGADPTSIDYAQYHSRLEALFIQSASHELHWCETFFASLNGTLTGAEVCLDNAHWPDASIALRAWHVAPANGYRSGRHFMLAVPVARDVV